MIDISPGLVFVRGYAGWNEQLRHSVRDGDVSSLGEHSILQGRIGI